MKQYNLAVIKGDGIGPEIVSQAMLCLNRLGEIYRFSFTYNELLAGGVAIDTLGTPLPEETIIACLKADSVLLGAVGGPKWDHLGADMRPEKALLGVRKELKLYTNLRPAILYAPLKDACPLKGIDQLDILIVRELTGGIYFGQKGRNRDNTAAFDTEYYTKEEILRIGKVGFEMARSRNKKLASIDKANILETSRLWRETMHALKEDYPDVTYSDILVDNAAMQLVKDPLQFDVLVTSNMFGDILSDEAAMLTGSIGMLPSASLGDGTSMYEPIHGSAPDIAGKNLANPIATIASVSMMLRHTFDEPNAAGALDVAIQKTLGDGYRTFDIKDDSTEKEKILGTKEMGQMILQHIS